MSEMFVVLNWLEDIVYKQQNFKAVQQKLISNLLLGMFKKIIRQNTTFN